MRTGLYSVKPAKVSRWDRPPYDKAATAPEFNRLLDEAFELCTEPDEVKRHFFECLGYLMAPSDIVPVKIVFFGSENSGKHEAFSVVKSLVEHKKLHKICFVASPPDVIHSDFDIAHSTVIPFYGEFRRVSDVPVYGFDIAAEHELSGIVNESMSGLKRLAQRGHFDPPRDVIKATSQYLRNVDHLGAFISDNLVILRDEAHYVPCRDVFHKYRNWYDDKRYKLSRKELIQELRARGIKTGYVNRNLACFFGIDIIE